MGGRVIAAILSIVGAFAVFVLLPWAWKTLNLITEREYASWAPRVSLRLLSLAIKVTPLESRDYLADCWLPELQYEQDSREVGGIVLALGFLLSAATMRAQAVRQSRVARRRLRANAARYLGANLLATMLGAMVTMIDMMASDRTAYLAARLMVIGAVSLAAGYFGASALFNLGCVVFCTAVYFILMPLIRRHGSAAVSWLHGVGGPPPSS